MNEFLVNSIGHWQGIEQVLNSFKEVLKSEIDETQSLVDTKVGELKELLQSELDNTQENQTNILTKLFDVYTGLLSKITEVNTEITNSSTSITNAMSDNFTSSNQKLDAILAALNTKGQEIVTAINGVIAAIENIGIATQTKAGLMSSEDKVKLDNLSV